MNINVKVSPGSQIRAFYLFFVLVNIQTGTGIMGAPRYIYEEAKHDAWISVLIAGAFVHLVIFMMFQILNKYENADIFGIQADLFGKWISRLLGTIIILYVFSSLLTVLLNYIEVVKYFIFPVISTWLISFLLVFLVLYSVLGGLRVIVGVAFTFFVSTLYLVFFLYGPIREMHLDHFMPMFQASPKELLLGARATSYSLFGLEILFFIYPFIDNKKRSQLASQLGVALAVFFLLLATTVSIGFFGRDQLAAMYWPVLILYKFVSFQVIERFDIIVVTGWMMVVVPIMILLTWMITYGVKRMYNIKQKKTLYVVSILLFFGGGLIREQLLIATITDYVSQIGFWIAFVYPFILYPLVLFKKRKKGGKN